MAAGVLNFDSDGLGHEMAEACLENLRKEFRGDDWGNNGPGVITRVLKKLCKARQVGSTVQRRLSFVMGSVATGGVSQRMLGTDRSAFFFRISMLHVSSFSVILSVSYVYLGSSSLKTAA